jgi:hypothetical protein
LRRPALVGGVFCAQYCSCSDFCSNYDDRQQRLWPIWLDDCGRTGKAYRFAGDGGAPAKINDEHDVQDLFHSLLLIFFDDVRKEEWTPSYAGGSARMDYLLPKLQTAVEVKKTRPTLTSRTLGEELIIDIAKYQNHPQCRKLLCFVYDPEGIISNPRSVETDLNRQHDNLAVRVMIVPRLQ